MQRIVNVNSYLKVEPRLHAHAKHSFEAHRHTTWRNGTFPVDDRVQICSADAQSVC
jgi:hypothetical protein